MHSSASVLARESCETKSMTMHFFCVKLTEAFRHVTDDKKATVRRYSDCISNGAHVELRPTASYKAIGKLIFELRNTIVDCVDVGSRSRIVKLSRELSTDRNKSGLTIRKSARYVMIIYWICNGAAACLEINAI